MAKDTITTAEAAELLGVSETHLRLMCRQRDKGNELYKDLPGFKRFGRWVWNKSDIENFVNGTGLNGVNEVNGEIDL